MKSYTFGRFRIEYDLNEYFPVILYDETREMLGWWDDLYEARMGIDYSQVGDEITLEQWQGLWDWIEQAPKTQKGGGK